MVIGEVGALECAITPFGLVEDGNMWLYPALVD
ncbi:hypothetical protein QO005_002533 [Rhizobium paknamense]|uniref:Uncharacterized protein n=1 Tax=Rhizobium paknamense TaxID=1206817 RepID=A0ABU0ID75_9HYPH|nr:hypothetical protein [Rhizobium paknamense]